MKCSDCSGTGEYVGFTERKKCPTCKGSGKGTNWSAELRFHTVFQQERTLLGVRADAVSVGASDTIEVMAILPEQGDRYRVLYNPAFVATCPNRDLHAIIRHELKHLLAVMRGAWNPSLDRQIEDELDRAGLGPWPSTTRSGRMQSSRPNPDSIPRASAKLSGVLRSRPSCEPREPDFSGIPRLRITAGVGSAVAAFRRLGRAVDKCAKAMDTIVCEPRFAKEIELPRSTRIVLFDYQKEALRAAEDHCGITQVHDSVLYEGPLDRLALHRQVEKMQRSLIESCRLPRDLLMDSRMLGAEADPDPASLLYEPDMVEHWKRNR